MNGGADSERTKGDMVLRWDRFVMAVRMSTDTKSHLRVSSSTLLLDNAPREKENHVQSLLSFILFSPFNPLIIQSNVQGSCVCNKIQQFSYLMTDLFRSVVLSDEKRLFCVHWKLLWLVFLTTYRVCPKIIETVVKKKFITDFWNLI